MTALDEVGYEQRSASDWYHLEKTRRASVPDTSYAHLMAEARAEFIGAIEPSLGGSVVRLDGTPRREPKRGNGLGRGRSRCACGGVKPSRAKLCAACVAKEPCKWGCGRPRANSTHRECDTCRHSRAWKRRKGRIGDAAPRRPAMAMRATKRRAA